MTTPKKAELDTGSAEAAEPILSAARWRGFAEESGRQLHILLVIVLLGTFAYKMVLAYGMSQAGVSIPKDEAQHAPRSP